MQCYHLPPWQHTKKFTFAEKSGANSTMSLLSLILHCLESGPVRNGLDLLCRWGESKEFSYLLYTGSQVLKATQWKGDVQYASSQKGLTHLGCASPSPINNIYFPSQYVFCITLELSFCIARLHCLLKSTWFCSFRNLCVSLLISADFKNWAQICFACQRTASALPLSSLHTLWP